MGLLEIANLPTAENAVIHLNSIDKPPETLLISVGVFNT